MAYLWNKDLPPPSYAADDDEARELLYRCLERVEKYPGEPFGFDTETHAKKLPFKVGGKAPLDWFSDTITFWSLAFRGEEGPERWCVQGQHFHMFIPLLENPNTELVIWNAKYDAHVSWNSMVNIWCAKVHDILVMANLYDENYQGKMSLKAAAPRWIGLNMTKFSDLFKDVVDEKGKPIKEYTVPLYDLPRDKVIDYASADAYAHMELFYYLRKELQKIPLAPRYTVGSDGEMIFDESSMEGRTMWDLYLEVDVDCCKTLWRMERRGILVDTNQLSETLPKIDKEILDIEREINRAAGRMVNINSPKQLQELFFNKKSEGGLGIEPKKLSKKTNKPSCDEDVLSKLAENEGIELAGLIIRGRGLNKVRSTYVAALLNMAEHFSDGRIHPSFNQYGARTGRFSTAGPNSQNFPRPDSDEFHIRRAFIATPGHALIVADYGQLEMRIMAHMSRDERMLQAITSGEDLHCRTVALMFPDVPYEAVVAAKKAENPTPAERELKTLRQQCKTIGFGIIYGIGPPGLAKQLGITFEEAKDKINLYLKKAFPGVNNYIKNVHAECSTYRPLPGINDEERQAYYVQTILGRRRRLPDITHHNRDLRGHAERESVNAIIQGTAADITKCAMLRIEFSEVLNNMELWLLNQIHDELMMEVRKDRAEDALKIVQNFMEHPFGDGVSVLDVPLPVDIKIVDNWAAAK